MRRAATAIGAVAIVATLATACGSSSSDAKSDSSTTTEAEAKATTTTASSKGPTKAQLEDALLTASQMGPDWVASSSSEETSGGCLTELYDDGTIPGPRVDVDFSYTAENGVTAYVSEGLAYAGSDSASVFSAVTKAISECAQSPNAPDGLTEVKELYFPTYGEDTVGFSGTFEDDGESLSVYMVAALQDDVIVLVSAGQTAGTMQVTAVEPVVEAAVANVEKAANA